MHGRGYVMKGDLKSANYIAHEFKLHKLKSLTENYFQEFDVSVNTQPGRLKISLNDTLDLIPGVDFLINPSSPSLSGEFKTALIETEQLLNRDLLIKKNKRYTGKSISNRYLFNRDIF